ncbi:MAG: hypothetical protein HDT21_10300 [Ruminococcus sp.]|nr:hypothetical protein [Ruminococcus sp.]
MAKVISKDNANGFWAWLGDCIVMGFGESINRVREEAFCEAIEIGIEKTFSALYDANVNDEEIINVVCKYWEISRQEAEDRLIDEKQQAAVRNLKQYMKRQNYREHEIDEFFQVHKVLIKIRRNKELWKLKNNPDKLFKDIQAQK